MTEVYVCPHCGEEIDFNGRRDHMREAHDQIDVGGD